MHFILYSMNEICSHMSVTLMVFLQNWFQQDSTNHGSDIKSRKQCFNYSTNDIILNKSRKLRIVPNT